MMKMKITCTIALCACSWPAMGVLTAADQQPAENKQAASAQTKPKPVPPPLALPASAIETAPGTYSYTDPQGKKWTYRRTPFGLARLEDRAPSTADLEKDKKAAEQYRAFDDGDGIRFERPGLFGTYRWRKKKTDLDSFEQTVWERERARQNAAREKE
jgi:hypothetical protein